MVKGLTTAADACGIAPVVKLSHTPSHTQTHTHLLSLTLRHSLTLTLTHSQGVDFRLQGFRVWGLTTAADACGIAPVVKLSHTPSLTHTHTLSISFTL